MNSPIQPEDIPTFPPTLKRKECLLTVCLIQKGTKRNLFPDNENENVRSTTPPPRGRPNGICYCPLDDCKCHYAPERPKNSETKLKKENCK